MDLAIKILIITAISIGCVIIITAICYFILKRTYKKTDDLKIKNGVRYTKSDYPVSLSGELVITHNEGDILLSQGKTYTAKKGGKIAPGKYTILSCDENTKSFNIRFGSFVREYKHYTSIVISEGDQICAVSHSVILR